MNFSAFTVGTRTFTAAEQAAAFDAYIQQDPYLSKHRGKYAERNGLVMPMFRSMDLSITQDLFHNIGGARNGFQIRLDIVNFGNLLNSNWGVSQRPVGTVNFNNQLQILTNPAVDAQGRSTYRLARREQRADQEHVPDGGNDRRTSTSSCSACAIVQLGDAVSVSGLRSTVLTKAKGRVAERRPALFRSASVAF